jgi:hypothetical protein
VDHFWRRFPLDDDAEPQRGVWKCWSLLAKMAATAGIEAGARVLDALDRISTGPGV